MTKSHVRNVRPHGGEACDKEAMGEEIVMAVGPAILGVVMAGVIVARDHLEPGEDSHRSMCGLAGS